MKHLKDNELAQALKVLQGPPAFATEAQITTELPELFPHANDQPDTPPAIHTTINPDDITEIHNNIHKILGHTPRHRGPGPAGERYEHFGVVSYNTHAHDAMTTVLTLLATNNVDHTTLNAFASARIAPLLKPNNKIRPIACGTIPRRIIATAIAKYITPKISTTINDHQFAIGVPSGSEHIHKLTQTLLDLNHDNAILSIDVKAAFSHLTHKAIITAIQKFHPTLEPILRPWITAQASYYCRLSAETTTTHTTNRGVPMGCPMAAAAFALTLHTALQLTAQELNLTTPTTILSYMDDINIITNHNNLTHALDTINTNLTTLGLELNQSKTECWINPHTIPLPDTHQTIKRTPRPMILKTTAEPLPSAPDNPNDATQYTDTHSPEHQRLITKRNDTATILNKLTNHGLSTHVAQALWRTATAGDATFTARTIGINHATATTLDTLTINLHEQWHQTELSNTDHVQLFTSIAEGGFGFTSTTQIKDTALIASWRQLAPTILKHTKHATFGELLNHTPNTKAHTHNAAINIDSTIWESLTEITPDDVPLHHQQKRLTSTLRDIHTKEYTATLGPRAHAIHHSTATSDAGAWLHAPIKDIVPFTNANHTHAFKLRLDKPHVQHNLPCPRKSTNPNCRTAQCPKQNNTHLDHTLACCYGPLRNRRHNALRDCLAELIFHTTGHQPLTEQVYHNMPTEPQSTHEDDDNHTLNRSDVTFNTATTTIHLDVMVTSAANATALAGTTNSTTNPGHAALGEQHKHKVQTTTSHPRHFRNPRPHRPRPCPIPPTTYQHTPHTTRTHHRLPLLHSKTFHNPPTPQRPCNC